MAKTSSKPASKKEAATKRRTRADSIEEQIKADEAAKLVCIDRISQTDAYIRLHPCAAKWTRDAVNAKASAFFAQDKVRKAIDKLRERAQTKNDKEIAKIIKGISIIAEFDPRLCYTDDGKLKKLKDMPDEVALAIESIDFAPDGNLRKIKTANRLQAQRLLGSKHRLWNSDDAQTPAGVPAGPQVNFNVSIDAANAADAGRIYREIMRGSQNDE